MDASVRPECLPGTCQGILGYITAWLTVPSDSGNILWLSGVAGSGKSTISTTVAESFRTLNRLGAFLFFDRNNQVGITASNVIQTIAHSLALSNGHIQSAICNVIDDDPAVVNAPIRTQFKRLLLDPLRSAQNHIQGPIIVILDALDECGDPNSRQTLLSLLSNEFPELPHLFRFFITSRRDSDIVDRFQSRFAEKRLNIGLPSSTADVLAFIRHEMDDIRERKNMGPMWPGEQNIGTLANLSGGLFIWASTASKFIDAFDPNKRLKILIDTGYNMKSLDELYAIALQNSGDWSDNTFSQQALAVLGAVVLGRVPMTDETMDVILGFEEGRSSRVLECLGCIVQWSRGQSARTLHASFGDYLTDHTRSGKKQWFIDYKIQNQVLSLGCLRVLKNGLQFNICGLEDSHRRNADVPGLSSRIASQISPSLSYSSHFWANHLQETGIDTTILTEVKGLMYSRFLYWLEVLSLLNQVMIATDSLMAAGNYARGWDETLEDFINDAVKFVAAFAPPIAQSVPHIYLSAVPFAPHKSRIAQQFSGFFPRTLNFQGPLGDHWPSIQKIFQGHSSGVTSIAFSPDGVRIVSGSEDDTVRVWDARTGDIVAGPFEGHSDWVTSVAFSPDGARIVSGSNDHTVRVWDARTGEIVAGPFEGHSKWVTSVAFSPDGARIVSGSWDQTVRVWDARTGKIVAGPFEGHSNSVTSVAFSPDGARIVSGSWDQTVRVWDARTGKIVAGPFEGHSNRVTSATFSPDGARIVSGSDDHTVRVWDARTGETVAGPFEGHSNSVTSVAFSPDGARIVSGSWDHTVRVWDARTGEIVAGPFEGHSNSVTSVAFSPDGVRIVSGSWDHTVRVWDARTSEIVAGLLEGHSNWVTSVAFSPDGARIVSGSWDRTVRVWDARTGEIVAGPFEGHDDLVTSVAFSPDGARIMSGSNDHTIRVWDARTGEIVAGPFEGHDDSVTSVAFSPDGARIMSGSDDHTIRVWDARTGEIVAGPFEGHSNSVASVAFSPDGARIAGDSSVCLWQVRRIAITLFPSLHISTGQPTSRRIPCWQ
ncbi:quinon protein alcohol dehydrogenase-like superfamily [Mycena sp. CBHHK59/15]|nr:quinon protein alcohol dehydrogenase-like superfamily [Mycena sp. CBHHK59/15]